MDARIVEFVEVLRQNGVRVGTSEVLDAARAAQEVGVEERNLLRATLQTTLVKRAADVPTFNRAFDFYFSGATLTLEALEKSLLRQIEQSGILEGDELEMVLYTLHQLKGEMSPLTQHLVEGDAGRIAKLLRGAVIQLDLSRFESAMQTGFFSRRLAVGMGADQVASDLKSIERELAARGVSTGGIEVVAKELGAAMRRLEALTRREVERQARARVKRAGDTLNERSFQSMSPDEIEQAQRSVRLLAERLKSRLVRKERSRRKGTLNVRRTLRQNMGWGGVPMVPRFRSRRPQRPDVVVLCDVSDSVRTASRIMLLFAYTLQSLFGRVRSFVFVSDLAETTACFRDSELADALELVASGRLLSLQANSNYGRVFETFVRLHADSLSRRTTVLVIGDGRNNQNPANVQALEEIRRQSKRLLWVCPEEQKAWGFGDSEMLRYAKACHQVAVVQSLDDLERLASRLVPQ